MDNDPTQSMDAPIPKSPGGLAVPMAIVLAGGLVAFAIYSRGPLPTQQQPRGGGAEGAAANVAGAVIIKPANAEDHIRGSLNADVLLIEYSDTECPYCKLFHPTMKQIIDEYGAQGKVAWIYRHLPLDSIHPKARKEAEATECAAKLGGNDKFWAYIDRLFEVTPSNNKLDAALLPKIAEDVGLDRAAFEQCLASGEFTQKIADAVQEAFATGARGTPYTLVLTKTGKQFPPIGGALAYPDVKAAVDEALAAK